MNAVYLTLAVLATANLAYSQCIPSCATEFAPIYAPSCGCGCPAPALVAAPAPAVVAAPVVVTPNSVAANLADTLSLLTVTTLLADTLPYGCPVVAPAVGYPTCGLGHGYLL